LWAWAGSEGDVDTSEREEVDLESNLGGMIIFFSCEKITKIDEN